MSAAGHRGCARPDCYWGINHVSLDHVLRLTVRFHVGGYHREADVALPAGSSLADLIPEIVTLCGAPRISRPWHAMTAGGQQLDAAVPLHQTPLDHGSVIVLTPRHESAAPVIRDAAESLVATAPGTGASGLPTAASLAGCAGLIILVLAFHPASVALAVGAAAAVAMFIWARRFRALGTAAVLLATLAAGASVLEAADPADRLTPDTLGWAGLAAVGAMLASLLCTGVLGGVGTRTGAALISLAVFATVGACGSFLPAHATGPVVAAAALVVGTGIPVIAALPGWASKAAGLRVPRVPTAGQDLAVADEVQVDVDDRARRAQRLHEGFSLGTAAALAPALLTIGGQGGGFALATCVAAAGAVLLHAARHHQPVVAWAWLLIGLAGAVGAALAAAHGSGHPLQLGIAGLVVLAAVAAPAWTPHVRDLEPTTVVWWERAESLAVAAALPLAAHQAGLFALIRGLG